MDVLGAQYDYKGLRLVCIAILDMVVTVFLLSLIFKFDLTFFIIYIRKCLMFESSV